MEWLGVLNIAFLSERIVILCVDFAAKLRAAYPQMEVSTKFLVDYYGSYLIANGLAEYDSVDDTVELVAPFKDVPANHVELTDAVGISINLQSCLSHLAPEVSRWVEKQLSLHPYEPPHMVKAMAVRSLLFGDMIVLEDGQFHFTALGRHSLLG
ncbi:MAG: hypothetical protein KF748_07855 [Xanthobacteraceae bacterium]|nr:hypothetical protein [Xanthobacteraceae bacterium]MCW5676583.1 hypothetical protein [Xanthobacteraceae bacterium]